MNDMKAIEAQAVDDDNVETLSEHYDLRDVYEQEIKPLLDQAFEKCQEHRLPFIANACFFNGEEDMEQHHINAFFGKGRTPPEYLIVLKVLQNKELAMKLFKVLPMLDLAMRSSGDDDAGQ